MSTVKPHENAIFERDGQMDGWKDGPTDGPTDKAGCGLDTVESRSTKLKIEQNVLFFKSCTRN